jgi:hypothetical protein
LLCCFLLTATIDPLWIGAIAEVVGGVVPLMSIDRYLDDKPHRNEKRRCLYGSSATRDSRQVVWIVTKQGLVEWESGLVFRFGADETSSSVLSIGDRSSSSSPGLAITLAKDCDGP